MICMDVEDALAIHDGDGQVIQVNIFPPRRISALSDQVALLVVDEVLARAVILVLVIVAITVMILGDPLAERVVEVFDAAGPVAMQVDDTVAVAGIVGECFAHIAGFGDCIARCIVGECMLVAAARDGGELVRCGRIGIDAGARLVIISGLRLAEPVAVGVIGEALRAVSAGGRAEGLN